MADEHSSKLRVLKSASDGLRLAYLLRAEREGTLLTREARALAAEQGSDSGNTGYHLDRLVRDGLLTRTRRGSYELTPPATRLLAALREPDSTPSAGGPQPGGAWIQVTLSARRDGVLRAGDKLIGGLGP